MTPSPARGHARRVGANALSGIAARAVTMLVGFALTPLIVHAIGLTTFGLWSILGSIVGYVGLLDFGLGGAFVKFITEFVERGRPEAARDVVSFGMAFYAGLGVVFSIPFFLLTPQLVHLFKMQAAETVQAVMLFRWLFVLFVAALALGLPSTMVIALHRMDVANRNNVVAYLLYALSVAVLLHAGIGIASLIIAGFIQLAVTSILQYATARRLFGGRIWSAPWQWDRRVIRDLFRFGGWTQLTSLFSIVSLDVGRFVTAAMVGVTHVAYYELGGRLSYLTLSLPGNFLNAVLPAAAAADARSDSRSLARMYRSGTIYTVFGTLLIAGFLVGAGDPVVRVWMGQPVPYVAAVVAVLAVGYAIGSLAEIGRTLLRASGHPEYETAFAAIAGVTSLLLAVLLAPRYGVIGAALGSSLGWVAGSVVFVTIFHRVRRVPFWNTVGAPTFRLFLASALATWGLGAVVRAPIIAPLFGERISGALVLAVAGAGYALAFAALAWIFGVERFDDARLFPRLRQALSVRFAGAAQGTH